MSVFVCLFVFRFRSVFVPVLESVVTRVVDKSDRRALVGPLLHRRAAV